jgi:hypothetical protein
LTVAFPVYKSNIVAEGLGRLTSAFSQQPNVRGWLTVYLQPFQDLENMYWGTQQTADAQGNTYGVGLLVARFLASATQYSTAPFNVVFDTIGAIVGQPRLGMTDPQYVTAIRLRIAVDHATGRTPEWSNFASILLRAGAGGPVEFLDAGQGSQFYFFVGDEVLIDPNVVASILAGAVPNGVYGVFGYSTWPDGNDFEFSDANNPSVTGQGTFGDSVAGVVGGLLVSGVAI